VSNQQQPQRREPEEKFQTGTVVAISFGHLFHDTFSAFLPPILPLLIKKLSLSYTLAGLLTIFQNLASVLNPFVGILADRISFRYLLILAPTVTAAAMSLVPLAPSYTFVAVMLLATGVATSCWHVPTPVIIRRVAGDRLGLGMSLFMVGGELARSLGPLVILGAVSLWGMEGTYRMIPFGAAASVVLFFQLRKVPIRHTGRPKGFRVLPALIQLRRFFLLIATVSFGRIIVARALNSFLPTYLTLEGSGLWLSGISLSVFELAGAAGVFIAGAASDLLGRRRLLLIISLGSPLLMCVFLLSSGLWILPVLIVLGVFSFAASPVMMALVQENARDFPASANGLYMSLNFAMGALSVLLVGALSDWIGMKNAYWICAALSLTGVPAALMLPKDPSRGEAAGGGAGGGNDGSTSS